MAGAPAAVTGLPDRARHAGWFCSKQSNYPQHLRCQSSLFDAAAANQGYCAGTQIQPFGYIRDLVAGKKEAAEDAPASS